MADQLTNCQVIELYKLYILMSGEHLVMSGLILTCLLVKGNFLHNQCTYQLYSVKGVREEG